MAKTTDEKVDELATAVELLTAQQRIIITQHDKILEFVDAIYTGMVNDAQAAQAPEAGVSAEDAMSMLKDLVGDESGEQSKPKASTSWGRNDGN